MRRSWIGRCAPVSLRNHARRCAPLLLLASAIAVSCRSPSRPSAGEVTTTRALAVTDGGTVEALAPLSATESRSDGARRDDARAPDDGRDPSSSTPADRPAPEALAAEEREPNPRSEEVTIKILVDVPKRARVFWGAKDLGLAPLEMRRPRGSGPVDLILRAPGYLTVHTRAFTDRDDRITVRLVPETEAPRMLGYTTKQ